MVLLRHTGVGLSGGQASERAAREARKHRAAPPRIPAVTSTEVVCTCPEFSLRAECEHVYFAEGLELGTRPSIRSFDRMVMPASQRGRPKGSTAKRRRESEGQRGGRRSQT